MYISHQSRFDIHDSQVFYNVNSYEEMNVAILQHGLQRGDKGSDEYNTFVGMAFEVFNEYFCSRYSSDPLLGIKNITDTSDDPYNDGFDSFVD